MITYTTDWQSRMFLYSATSPTQAAYDAAKVQYNDWKVRALLDRQNPKFVQQATNTGNYWGHDVAYSPTSFYYVRISNNAGTNTLLMERRTAGGAFSSTLVFRNDAKTNGSIRMYWDQGAGKFRYWYIKTDNTLVSGTVNSAGNAEVDAPVTVASNVADFAVVPQDGSAFPVYYTATNIGVSGTAMYFYDGGSGFNLLFQWPFPIESFDVVDLTVITGFTLEVVHLLALSAQTAPYYIYSSVSGNTPQKTAQFTGGLFSFLIHPPGYSSRGSKFNIGGPYPVHAFDNFEVNSFNNRYGMRLSKWGSDFGASVNQVYLTCIGYDGELTASGNAAYFEAIYNYATRDGKNWTQDRLLPVSGYTVLPEYRLPVLMPVSVYSTPGGPVDLYGRGSWATSNGAAMFFNAETGYTRFDVTDAIVDMQTDWGSDVRTCSLTLNNPGGKYNNTFITNGDACTLRLYFEKAGVYYPVGQFEVDNVNIQRQLPVQTIQISARDRMGWLYDRSTCPDSRPLDNTIIGYDNFADIAGKPNTGLAHMATVAGSLKTGSSKLIVQPSYKESIGFSTWKTNMASGAVQATFDMTVPSGNVGGAYGQTPTSSNAPSYAGVVFRAIDKDNLWFVRYNYWNSSIELGVRLNATDTIKSSYGPGGTFVANATNGTGVGIRVEFDLYNITIYVCENKSSLIFKQIANTYLISNAVGVPSILTGYVGVIGSGYSDETANNAELNPYQLVGVSV